MSRDSRYALLERVLLQVRQGSGLTQREVASRLGKPQSFISKYESGERRLDVIEFLAVCEALKADPMMVLKILDGDDKKEIYS